MPIPSTTTTTTTETKKTSVFTRAFDGAKNVGSIATGNANETYTGSETFWVAAISAGTLGYLGYNFGHKEGRNGVDNKFGNYAIFKD